jgi:hypothetical protein
MEALMRKPPFVLRFFDNLDDVKPEYIPEKPYDFESQTRWSLNELLYARTRDSGEQTGSKPSTEGGDRLD